MDFFVYGCTNVLRYISLTNHTCLLYNLNDQLSFNKALKYAINLTSKSKKLEIIFSYLYYKLH